MATNPVILKMLLERTRIRQEQGIAGYYPKNKINKLNCRFRGKEPIRSVQCETCSGKVFLKVYSCEIYGECTISRRVSEIKGCCQSCSSYISL